MYYGLAVPSQKAAEGRCDKLKLNYKRVYWDISKHRFRARCAEKGTIKCFGVAKEVGLVSVVSVVPPGGEGAVGWIQRERGGQRV